MERKGVLIKNSKYQNNPKKISKLKKCISLFLSICLLLNKLSESRLNTNLNYIDWYN